MLLYHKQLASPNMGSAMIVKVINDNTCFWSTTTIGLPFVYHDIVYKAIGVKLFHTYCSPIASQWIA